MFAKYPLFHFSVASVMVDCTDTLFTPGKLGELPLKNRIIYPAMTRGRCGGRLAGSENIKYYAARAGKLHHLPTSRLDGTAAVDTPSPPPTFQAQASSSPSRPPSARARMGTATRLGSTRRSRARHGPQSPRSYTTKAARWWRSSGTRAECRTPRSTAELRL